MAPLGLETDIVDRKVYDNTVKRFREAGIFLPTLSMLADPSLIPDSVWRKLESIDPNSAHPLNLMRVHWFNGPSQKGRVTVPQHVVLPKELTGVDAQIVVVLGENFPMITAHKVLAAYGCLVPRIVTGQFDPTHHRAVWPSTGNYCRGGVAISRIMQCRGVAVLPEGMSQERFDWLDDWVVDPSDVIRTPGTESNVKEIYDECKRLEADEHNVIFNQFCEFGNHLVHYSCTGNAVASVFDHLSANHANAQLRAFVSATGSAGTIAAGDFLKEKYDSKTVALEALECPTLLYNGFGEHNIQGIGDKHIPYIHNAMSTDAVVAVSDVATDSLNLLFNTDAGRIYLTERRGIAPELVANTAAFGLSSLGNILGAIKTAKYFDLGPDDFVATVATDGARMYGTERDKTLAQYFSGTFDQVSAGETFGAYLQGCATDNFLELTHTDRNRIFNLGYFTWVEQQGVSVEKFEARRRPDFWRGLRDLLPTWDGLIDEFNAASGVRIDE